MYSVLLTDGIIPGQSYRGAARCPEAAGHGADDGWVQWCRGGWEGDTSPMVDTTS